MKLYFIPGACSLAVNIALREAGLPFELVRVDPTAGTAGNEGPFKAINPKGYVPALRLDEGELLTETVAVLQLVADRAPSSRLAPPFGTFERYRLMEWLSFINSEIHKGFSPLYADGASDAVKAFAREHLANRLTSLNEALPTDFLLGNRFSIADAYLYTVLSWCGDAGLDVNRWPALARYRTRIAQRPLVIAALASEAS